MTEVTLDSVGLRFGSYGALQDLSFEVPRGQFAAIVGPTGCGKSSVLNLIGGLLKPSAGKVFSGGREISTINRDAVYMFQQDALLPWKTALENVMLGPLLRGVPRQQAVKDARLWLERVKLRDLDARFPSQLSGGQRKRVAMAQALINRLGFNSPGADAVAGRLASLRRRAYPIPLGVNIGRSAAASNDEAPDDYAYAFDRLHAAADFVVANLSSPNTPGLRALQRRQAIVPLLDRLAERNRALGEKPLFVKVAPDLTDEELEEIVEAVDGRAHGLVATNTTLRRNGLRSPARGEAGGVSGRPLRDLTTGVIRTLRKLTGSEP